MADEAVPQVQVKAEKLEGLGGWLILPAIGMFLNLFLLGKSLLGLAALALPGVADKLAAAGIDVHDPAWVNLVTFEAVATSVLFLVVIVSLVLFFMRSAFFPPIFIAFLAGCLIMTCGDMFLSRGMDLPGQSSADSTTSVFRALIVCLIWIPYFLVSVRVKNTFIRHRRATPASAGVA